MKMSIYFKYKNRLQDLSKSKQKIMNKKDNVRIYQRKLRYVSNKSLKNKDRNICHCKYRYMYHIYCF